MDIQQYLGLLVSVFWIQRFACDCPATVHPDIKGFGLGCRYRCNCQSNVQCDEVTGECPTGCLHGWMGPACQYRNYVTASSTTVGQYYRTNPPSDFAKKAIDGNISTCSRTGPGQPGQPTQQWWHAEFPYELYIVGLVIKIPESETVKFKGFTVEIGNTTDSYDMCYTHGSDEEGEIIMDVNCVQPMVGKVVKIQLAANIAPPLVLCEVELYGGRLVSFNKRTSLNSVTEFPTGSFWSSSYAVDGRQMIRGENQNTESERTCTATGDYTNPPATQWWKVFLEHVFSIQGISFFGRINDNTDQYKSYSVRVGVDNSDYQPIFTDEPSDNVNDYNPKSKHYTTPFPGSIVRVGRKDVILAICEFEVFGECPLGTCGWECNITCMCSSQTTGQHKIEGTCPYGCSGRWSGTQRKCNIECSETEWGPYCNNTCGECKESTSCSVSNGICPESCRPGWIPSYCTHECRDGYFGQDCNATCGNCKNDITCNKEDGQCPSGCKPGYKPPPCIEKCGQGSYGDNCSESCGKCLHGQPCDHVTGNCPKGCDPGFQGINCKRPCDAGSYGINCLGKCGSCKDAEACNTTTGECSSGCSSGWLTEFCKKPCDKGFYGDNCTETCGYCFDNSPCSNEDGACSRCAAGYHGTVCKTECDQGRYGENCDSVCGNCAGNNFCNRTSGVCPFGCLSGYKGELCSFQENGHGISTETMVGAIVGVVAVVAIATVVFVIFKRRSKRHAKSTKSENGSATFTNTELKVNPTDRVQSSERTPSIVQDAIYSNETNNEITAENRVKVSCLRAYSHASLADPSLLYSEFQDLPHGLAYDASEASDIKYKSKNRYKDMYPYNTNRVILPEIPGERDSTYINASYINGYDVPRKYIAAQGALETTVHDIWRMVWSEKVSVIVMLTNCFELGRLKCVQYWSDEGSKVYGDISTDIVSVEEYTDFKIRTFHCKQTESGEKRTIVHFHYTAWPDKDVPDTALSLVQFWRKVRGHQTASRIPWMVHCSAGVGRTGTFIALDYLYEQGGSENSINVKDGVHTLRQQRLNMVQTKHQYVYLHEAIAEALDPIGNVCENDKFSSVYRNLFTDDGTPARSLLEEFDILCKDTAKFETEESLYCNDSSANSAANKRIVDANLQENTGKSRNLNIIPDDLHRPRLGTAVHGRNDFINAVFVPTYRQKDRLILTQFPLSKTTVDFVRMVWEFDIDTVVLLDETVSGEGVYWPSKAVPKIISPFTAEHVVEKKEEYYTLRTVRYTYRESEMTKEVRIFHFRSWEFTHNTPENTASMLRLICDIENESKEKRPFVVQCIDGAEKSGLFCVLCCVLERMKTDSEVAIADTVRQIRLRRKQVISSFEQYIYCYRIVRDYLESHDVYANVM